MNSSLGQFLVASLGPQRCPELPGGQNRATETKPAGGSDTPGKGVAPRGQSPLAHRAILSPPPPHTHLFLLILYHFSSRWSLTPRFPSSHAQFPTMSANGERLAGIGVETAPGGGSRSSARINPLPPSPPHTPPNLHPLHRDGASSRDGEAAWGAEGGPLEAAAASLNPSRAILSGPRGTQGRTKAPQ